MLSRRLDIGLVPGALATLLLAALILQVLLPVTTESSASVAPFAGRTTTPASRQTSEPPIAAVADFPQILARPLFSPTRTSADAVSEAGAAAAQLSDYTVVGSASARGRAMAVLRSATGQVLTVHTGDTLLGWRVAAIGRDAVVFEVDGRKRILPVAGTSPAGAPPLANLIR
jgi:hypothetical protein